MIRVINRSYRISSYDEGFVVKNEEDRLLVKWTPCLPWHLRWYTIRLNPRYRVLNPFTWFHRAPIFQWVKKEYVRGSVQGKLFL